MPDALYSFDVAQSGSAAKAAAQLREAEMMALRHCVVRFP
jgi:hypothetical protein